MNYEKINIWNFPPERTYIHLKDDFRIKFINSLLKKYRSPEIINILNKNSKKYNIKKKLHSTRVFDWRRGKKETKSKKCKINIPLWVLIEISHLTNSKNNLVFLEKMQKNIEYYCSTGYSNGVYNPNLPILVTPEFVSGVFHFCGDGHLNCSKRSCMSSYRQINKEGLNNFHKKLKNCFGEFGYGIDSYNEGKLHVPKIIAELYKYYFKIKRNNWDVCRIPNKIKKMSKEFLVAGLNSFIIDEGHIREVIEIYSKNKLLINDIRQIALKCGYKCYSIKEKYARGNFDSYRFNISIHSYLKMNEDILKLKERFPTCDFAHKQKVFDKWITYKNQINSSALL